MTRPPRSSAPTLDGAGAQAYAFERCPGCGVLLAVRGEERLSPVLGVPHTCQPRNEHPPVAGEGGPHFYNDGWRKRDSRG